MTSSTNNQYTLELLDSYGDSWTSGSYLTIYGESNNVVFKNFLTASSEETYTFSLYYGVTQSDTWKMTSGSISGDWTAYSFSDSTWTDATLGSVTTTVSGTQYFRKQFSGLSSMAAYDVRLYYKDGVIAYINGAEVYRDNMPAGDVTSSTTATGQYTEPTQITITVPDGYTAYYTMDGTTPTSDSERYTGPVDMPENSQIIFNAVLINNNNGKATDVTTRNYITRAE